MLSVRYYRHQGRETKTRLIVNAQDAASLPGEFRSYAVIVPSRAWLGAVANVVLRAILGSLILCSLGVYEFAAHDDV